MPLNESGQSCIIFFSEWKIYTSQVMTAYRQNLMPPTEKEWGNDI